MTIRLFRPQIYVLECPTHVSAFVQRHDKRGGRAIMRVQTVLASTANQLRLQIS